MRSLLRGGVYVFAATFVWQLSNFVFNAVGAHELGPVRYGILAASIGLLYLLNPFIAAIQTFVSRETTSVAGAAGTSSVDLVWRRYARRLCLWTGIATFVAIAASGLISRALHLTSPELVMLFAISLPLTAVSTLLRGAFLGSQHFGRYSLGMMAEALTKIAVAVILLVMIWRSPLAGMAAVCCGAFAGLACNFVLAKRVMRVEPEPPADAGKVGAGAAPVRYAIVTLASFSLLAILLSADTLAARRLLAPHLAGLYAGVSLSGKIVYYATAALTPFLFPHFSAMHDRGKGSLRWLAVSGSLVTAGALVIVGVFAVAPQLVVDTLLGLRFRGVEYLMPLAGGVFAVYGLVYLTTNYLLARREGRVAFVLGGAVVVQLGGFTLFHSSMSDLLLVLVAAFSTGLLGCAALVVVAEVSGRAPRSIVNPHSVVDRWLAETAAGRRPD